MKLTHITIGVLALTTIGGAALAGWQYQRARALASEVSKLNKTIADNAERAQRRSSSSRGQPPGDGAPPADGRQGPGGGQSRQSNTRAAVLESEEGQRLMKSQQRGTIEMRYAGLFKALNLPPAQLAKFKDLLLEKQNVSREVMAVAREQGLDPRANSAEMQQLIQQFSNDVDETIKAAIGQDKFDQYQTYDQTQRQRAFASQLEQRLSYTGSPLTQAQTDQIISLLAGGETAPSGRGSSRALSFGWGTGYGPGGGGGMSISNKAIREAQAFLNPEQIDVLRQMQAEYNDQRQLQQLLSPGSGGQGGAQGSGSSGRKTKGSRN